MNLFSNFKLNIEYIFYTKFIFKFIYIPLKIMNIYHRIHIKKINIKIYNFLIFIKNINLYEKIKFIYFKNKRNFRQLL